MGRAPLAEDGKAQVSARGPEALAVGGRADEAHRDLVGREDPPAELGELGRQGILALVPRVKKFAQEEVVVDPAEKPGGLVARAVARECARDGRGVPAADEVLLERDLTLREDVADVVGVVEAGGAPDLSRYVSQALDLLGEGRGAHHEGRGGVVEPLGRVDLGEEAEPAEVRLDERVQVGGGSRLGVELAEKVGEHADVGQLVGREATQVEVVVDVGDAVRVELVGDAGKRRLDHGGLGLGGCVLDVGHGELGERGERLGLVGGLLLGAQGADLLGHGGEVGVGHPGAAGRQLGLLLGRVAALHGHEFHLGRVLALADDLAEKLLVEAVLEPRLGVGERLLVVDVVERALVVVEPGRHDDHGEGHAVGVAAPVALAQVELGLGERGGELVARDALLGELGAGRLEQRAELLRAAGLDAAQGEHGLRLQDAVDEGAVEVVGEPGVEDRALERGLVGAAQRVEKHVDGEDALALGGLGDNVRDADLGVVLGGGHLDARGRGRHGRLEGKLVRGPCAALAGAGEVPGHEGELSLDVHVAVEHGVAVGEVVVARVGLEELLVGERGDGARVSARLEAVGRVGVELARKRLVEHVVRVGERALHLVEDHAVVGERRLGALALDLEVPALLLKDPRAGIDRRVQDRVQVDAHEVLEVGGVRGGNGVHRLVREREGVQERLHARLEQVDECSRMWKTPVSSAGGVLNEIANDLFTSAQASHSRRAPEASCRMT